MFERPLRGLRGGVDGDAKSLRWGACGRGRCARVATLWWFLLWRAGGHRLAPLSSWASSRIERSVGPAPPRPPTRCPPWGLPSRNAQHPYGGPPLAGGPPRRLRSAAYAGAGCGHAASRSRLRAAAQRRLGRPSAHQARQPLARARQRSRPVALSGRSRRFVARRAASWAAICHAASRLFLCGCGAGRWPPARHTPPCVPAHSSRVPSAPAAQHRTHHRRISGVFAIPL